VELSFPAISFPSFSCNNGKIRNVTKIAFFKFLAFYSPEKQITFHLRATVLTRTLTLSTYKELNKIKYLKGALHSILTRSLIMAKST
jgi:hypothetical protein